MKNSIKRAQSQARLSFAERENQRSLAGGKSNFRPKVRQLKKTLLTLVALLAVTTGAWADNTETVNITAATVNGTNVTVTATGYYSDACAWITYNGETIVVTSKDGSNFEQLVLNIKNNEVNAGDVNASAGTCTVDGKKITVTGINASSVTFRNDDSSISISSVEVTFAASSGPEVAWDKAEKTGSFKMPGGNVTLEPDYYPQATVAEGAVTAADADARATTDDPLVKVDATKLTGAKKLMYFVSNSGTTAPAYDAEGWTDQLPTAEGFTQQGIVYVWYYPVGTDEGVDGATATYSDGDICLQSITARIADAPTYAVTFADDLSEPDKWTASPAAGVTKGQTVTVTYTGTKKVIGVKAEKKAKAPAGPVTYTELKGGEVLHVGDILNFSDANVEYLFDGCTLMQLYCPFTVLRANITGDFKPIVTPADDGAYYVMQDKDGGYYFRNKSLPATATSDGILITINSEDGNYRYCTASVHEP